MLRYFGKLWPRIARWNIRHSATPSTMPLWTPNPMMRRVNWSITTRTQHVLRVADSHRKRSQLHKLSFVWPRNVSQEGPADIWLRPVMNAQDSANNILVDLDAERQRDLLSNAGTAPVGIAPFRGNDGVDEVFLRSLRTRAMSR